MKGFLDSVSLVCISIRDKLMRYKTSNQMPRILNEQFDNLTTFFLDTTRNPRPGEEDGKGRAGFPLHNYCIIIERLALSVKQKGFPPTSSFSQNSPLPYSKTVLLTLLCCFLLPSELFKLISKHITTFHRGKFLFLFPNVPLLFSLQG